MNPLINITKSRFNLRETLDKTLSIIHIIARKKRVEILCEIDTDVLSCYTDPLLLSHTVYKCLENAVRHSPPESPVILSVNNYQNGTLLFTVKDFGIGMDENGPCPALIEGLTDMMGGKVWYESNPGIGSIFYFTIKIDEEHCLDNYLSRPLKILLVDDSLDNRNIILAYLRKFPFEIQIAENGADALALMKNNHYDLVLMDIQMPVMDGLTATRIFRDWEKQNQKTHLPIAALTAFALKEDYYKSIKAGCDLHITKPVKKVTILETIKELVSKTA